MTWEGIYKTDAQAVYAPWVVPLLFLAWLATSRRLAERAPLLPSHASFVRFYCILFAIETLVDPLATGPLLRWLGADDDGLGTALPLGFVLLGDFRVFWLLLALAMRAPRPGLAAARAVPWTLVVPATAYATHALLRLAKPDLPGQVLWLIYELAFVGLTAFLAERVLQEAPVEVEGLRRYLRGLLAYVAGYYLLWATADVGILLGFDRAWALRLVPNQLYYALWVPAVFLGFFRRGGAARRQAASV